MATRQEVRQFAAELWKKAGGPAPRVVVADDPAGDGTPNVTVSRITNTVRLSPIFLTFPDLALRAILAHELGHIIAPQSGVSSFERRFLGVTRDETAADVFAAILLGSPRAVVLALRFTCKLYGRDNNLPEQRARVAALYETRHQIRRVAKRLNAALAK